MVQSLREELYTLESRHKQLADEIRSIGRRLTQIEQKDQPSVEAQPPAHHEYANSPSSESAQRKRKNVPGLKAPVASRPSPSIRKRQATGVGITELRSRMSGSIDSAADDSKVAQSSVSTERAPTVTEPPEVKSRSPEQPAVSGSSLELTLGTYWFVRVGVFMLLTAVGFFGYYAYEHYIPQLGPVGKISLLYLGSGTMLAAGAWCQRSRAGRSLENYGHVLLAGGLAAVYFTTYAAHHIEALRVIPNLFVDGLLLFGWAGFMVWLADRKRSEVMATFAIGLAFYTSVITQVGWFTLISNLILTVAAVVFLIRNRWSKLTVVSAIATYGSFGFWRFFYQNEGQWSLAGQGNTPWISLLFLGGYFVVFATGVFAGKAPGISSRTRLTLANLNNGAFYGLAILSMLEGHPGTVWQVSLAFGAVLLTLSQVARRVFPDESAFMRSFLAQGLLLATIGLVSKFSGHQLAMVLATKSVLLFLLAHWQKEMIYKLGSLATGLMATGWALGDLAIGGSPHALVGATVGACLCFNAFWARRVFDQDDEGVVLPWSVGFACMGMLVWLVGVWELAPDIVLAPALAAMGLIMTLVSARMGLVEIAVLAQGYLLAGQMWWMSHGMINTETLPWWNPLVLIAATLAASHWWAENKRLKLPIMAYLSLQGAYSAAIVLTMIGWLRNYFAPDIWMVVVCGLAVGVSLYGIRIRLPLLAAASQIFMLYGLTEFGNEMTHLDPAWYLTATVIVIVFSLSWLGFRWAAIKPGSTVGNAAKALAEIYRWLALPLTIVWILKHTPRADLFWCFTAASLLAIAIAGWKRQRAFLLFSAAYAALGVLNFWFVTPGRDSLSVLNLLALLSFGVAQQICRRSPAIELKVPEIDAVFILLTGLNLWIYVSRWMLQFADGFLITASWATLALVMFVAGLAMTERYYRWASLFILGAAVSRVIVLDVWELETIFRIVSFMALGLVLVVLGFIYNRFQETIRRWL